MTESMLKGKYFRVLDKGYVGLVDVMGGDVDLESAARTSYGKGTRSVNDTRNLIRYLMRHRHSTPFEMGELKFHVKVPMDCWRQWIRHRTASVNEYSTRYSEAIDEKQQTSPMDWRPQATNNKQGSGNGQIKWGDFEVKTIGLPNNDPGTYLSWRESQFHDEADRIYQERLTCGVAREQARKDLPLSNYTVAYWKMDLKNLLGFMSLRCDSHAQLEIREYANVIAGFVKELFPMAFEAWYDYHYQSVSFSRLERMVLWDLMNDEDNFYDNNSDTINNYAKSLGMSKREITEFWKKLELPTEQDFSLDFSKEIDMENE